MANLEIEGRICQKFNIATGQSARGPWKKQDFLVEYQDGNYMTKTMFTAFGDNIVADLEKYAVGDTVRVFFNIKAREYNGRWYNDVRVWKITGEQAPVQPQAPELKIEDMPEPESNDGSEDLPF